MKRFDMIVTVDHSGNYVAEAYFTDKDLAKLRWWKSCAVHESDDQDIFLKEFILSSLHAISESLKKEPL